MKRFRFRLERVLELRQRVEKDRARALGVALRDEDARRKVLQDAEARLERCGDQVKDAGEVVRPAGLLNNLSITVRAAADDVAKASDEHKASEACLEGEQSLFREAKKDRRVVEMLREKRRAGWEMQASREEQKDIDEVSHHRRAAGGDR